MNARTTLTKSLHTVSVVARVANTVYSGAEPDSAVRQALHWLGLEFNFPETDPTFAACVAKVAKLRGGK